MAYAIFVDDELKPIAEEPGRRNPMPDSMREKFEEVSATALLNIVRLAAGDDINVEEYWNPKEALNQIEKATSAPVVVILDILNERRSSSTSISEDSRCGLVLGERVFQKWPDVPIIFLTQFDCHEPERGRVSKIKSCRDYITKHTSSTISLLQDRVQQIVEDFRGDRGIVCGRLRLDPIRQKMFWRDFELGSIAKVLEWPKLKEDLDLSGTRLKPGELKFLECLMKRARACWDRPKPTAGRVSFEDIRKDCGDLSDDMIHQNVSRIRKRLLDVQVKLFNDDPADVEGIFVSNRDSAYLLTER